MNYSFTYDKYGTRVVNPFPTSEELREYYTEKYYQCNSGQYSASYTSKELQYFNFFNELICYASQVYCPCKITSFADIGCGEGYASAFFCSQGIEVFASDFSDFGMRLHNPDCLNEITFKQCDIVADDSMYCRKYDLILVKNVLEHVVDLERLVLNLKRSMHADSLLVVQVPNDTQNPFLDFYRNERNMRFVDSKMFCPPEHLRYFSHKSLGYLWLIRD